VPVAFDGILYVSNSNEVHALDARSGRSIWVYRQQGVESQRTNRGVGLLGDRVFFVTSDCHLIALHRKTGALFWDQQYADPAEGYHCTMSPYVVKNRVMAGVSGGDSGMRGFLSARDPETGDEVWRFWTIPAKGEPGSETWGDKTLAVGGAGTWMGGSYDPELNTLYWPTGNPWPDFYAGDRPGDNLYSDSVLALDPDTGKLKWYFQFTPHDAWDWDAQEFPILLDLPYEGKERKLLVHINRNGFRYVLDRVNGEFLQATPFVDKLTWATGVDKKGRPILVPGMEPSPGGVEVCPTVRGASNYMTPSFNPDTGLLYIVALEGCDIFTSSAKDPVPNIGFAGTGAEAKPRSGNQFFIRAIKPATGERVWEYPMTGPIVMWAGTLSTAGGVVFFGDDDHHLVAVDATTGEHLWHFNTGQQLFSSPITYMVDGKQYVTMVSQTDVLTFALFEEAKPIPILTRKVQPQGGQ
jgi:alcohol dehydrogenase (cytochrome c)